MTHSEGRSGSAGSDSGDLSDDVLYEILSDRRRRYALATLSRQEEPVALADLAREIAALEEDDVDAPVPSETSRRVQTELYHVHVPKLVAADLVDFDRETRTVIPAELGPRLETVLESLVSSR